VECLFSQYTVIERDVAAGTRDKSVALNAEDSGGSKGTLAPRLHSISGAREGEGENITRDFFMNVFWDGTLKFTVIWQITRYTNCVLNYRAQKLRGACLFTPASYFFIIRGITPGLAGKLNKYRT
jgi:hypothetical protein